MIEFNGPTQEEIDAEELRDDYPPHDGESFQYSIGEGEVVKIAVVDSAQELQGMLETLETLDTLDEASAEAHRATMARYYVHKLRVHQYQMMMQNGMPLAEARVSYQRAMVDYDSLMRLAGDGAMSEASVADMHKGFPLHPDDPTEEPPTD